jgi:hypothetical protein
MFTRQISTICCDLCRKVSVTTCTGCDDHFCWDHFCEHRQKLQRLINDARGEPELRTNCLEELKNVENELHSKIDNWKLTETVDIHHSTDEAKKKLETEINNSRLHFEENSLIVLNNQSADEDAQLIQIDKLQTKYRRDLENICIVLPHGERRTLEVKTIDPTEEEMSLQDSTLISPSQCGIYQAKSTLGKRLLRELPKSVPIGDYWAIGGSDEHILVQDYQTDQLRLFDRYGKQSFSMTWDHTIEVSIIMEDIDRQNMIIQIISHRFVPLYLKQTYSLDCSQGLNPENNCLFVCLSALFGSRVVNSRGNALNVAPFLAPRSMRCPPELAILFGSSVSRNFEIDFSCKKVFS